jgi:hypothetical protein
VINLKRNLYCILLAIATFALATQAEAQTTYGSIRGLVTDTQGAAIAHANVVLTEESTHLVRNAETTGAGEYFFSSVAPGRYAITVDLSGFKKIEQKGIIVELGAIATADLKLELGATSETVEVTATEPLISTATASGGQSFDEQKLQTLPNLGRNPFEFGKQDNNVTPVGDPRYVRFEDQTGSSTISIGGGPIQTNNFAVDGIPITASNNTPTFIPTIEAVAETKVQANTYDAEVGRTGGGMLNTTLKSGSNTLHGTLWGVTSQTNWDANLFFNNRQPLVSPTTGTIISPQTPRPATETYKYAGAIGGPIVIPHIYNGMNKTFFWLAEEGYRQAQPLLPATATYVPTVAERAGDFTADGIPIYDPTQPFTAGARTVLVSCVKNGIPTNNCLSPSYINAVGQALVNEYPVPSNTSATYGSNNFFGSDDFKTRADEFVGKLDEQVFRWWLGNVSYVHYASKEPSGNALHVPTENYTLLYRKVDAVATNNTFTINPTTIATFGFGFNRYPNNSPQASSGFNQTTLGLPASYVSALPAKDPPSLSLGSSWAALGGADSGPSSYFSRNVIVGISKTIGKHQLKAGYVFRSISADSYSLSGSNGSFTFNGEYTSQKASSASLSTASTGGTPVADLLMGLPSAASVQINSGLYEVNTKYNAVYFQDDIRLTPKLTINAGIRYEHEPGFHEINNKFVVGFSRTAVNPIPTTGASPLGGVEYAGVNGNPTYCCDYSNLKFGPRFGVAYAVKPTTVIHAGIGVFYAPVSISPTTLPPGYSATTSYSPVASASSTTGTAPGAVTAATVGPGGYLSNPFSAGLGQPTGNTLGLLTGVGGVAFPSAFPDQYRRSPIVDQYSFDVQQELPYGMALKLGWVGEHARNLPNTVNIDQIPDSYLSQGSALATKITNPYYSPTGTGFLANKTQQQGQFYLPFPEFSTVSLSQSVGKNRYNSLIVKLQKRFSKGLTFLSGYTWSSNWDNSWGASDTLNTVGSGPQDFYNIGAEFSRAVNDIPNRFTASASYELPFGRGKQFLGGVNRWVDMAVGGWTVNDVTILQNGGPLAITQTNANSGTGVNGVGGSTQRPNWSSSGVNPCGTGKPEGRLGGTGNTPYMNIGAFTAAAAYTYGNVPRQISCSGPGYINSDMSVNKDFKAGERIKLQFRAEALNAFNKPQFASPANSISSSTFGAITTTLGFPRIIQMGGRLTF